jgi:hypothetical protein
MLPTTGRLDSPIPILGSESKKSNQPIKNSIHELKQQLEDSFHSLNLRVDRIDKLLDQILPFAKSDKSTNNSALVNYLDALLAEDAAKNESERYARCFKALQKMAAAIYCEFLRIKHGEISSAQLDDSIPQHTFADNSRIFVSKRKGMLPTTGMKGDPHKVLVTRHCYAYCNNTLLYLEKVCALILLLLMSKFYNNYVFPCFTSTDEWKKKL